MLTLHLYAVSVSLTAIQKRISHHDAGYKRIREKKKKLLTLI